MTPTASAGRSADRVMPRVAVVGGSLGGLTAALFLRDLGCDVQIFERSGAELEARGAGIAVLDQTLRYPVERRGVAAQEFCSHTDWIRFLHADGSIQHQQKHPYRFSSWNAVYRTLMDSFDRDRYHLSAEMASLSQTPDHVELVFTDGEVVETDLLVCADGINSTGRELLLPEVSPTYAGYIAWRGVIGEWELTPDTYEALHDALTYQLLPHSHILVYPIPGPDGAVAQGRRLMNIVWYRNVAEDALADLLTDRDGHRHSVSLPPGAVRQQSVAEMRRHAAEHLAPPIAEVVGSIPEPFVQAVFDIEVPRMVEGRVCLLGDAAFAVRPHAAAGTAKAAEDGYVLALELAAAGGEVVTALRRWEQRQMTLGQTLLERTREIGDSSQFTGTFRPGDPRLVFGLYEPGE